jgi:hypothetical protein
MVRLVIMSFTETRRGAGNRATATSALKVVGRNGHCNEWSGPAQLGGIRNRVCRSAHTRFQSLCLRCAGQAARTFRERELGAGTPLLLGVADLGRWRSTERSNAEGFWSRRAHQILGKTAADNSGRFRRQRLTSASQSRQRHHTPGISLFVRDEYASYSPLK